MSESFEFIDPDHFAAGVIGEPGQRTFFIQAGGNGVVLSFKCEKQQVSILAEYLADIMADLPAPPDRPTTGNDLVEPVIPEWTVGTMGVAYDEADGRVVLVLEEFRPEDDDDTDATALRLRVPLGRIAVFIDRARELVGAGRPPCPLCGGPMDPTGHVCPRTNGHRPKS